MDKLINAFTFDPINRGNMNYLSQIIIGLMCCANGDALLNYEHLEFGMILFAFGHICYIVAFGWKPLELWIAQILYSVGAIGKIPHSFFLYSHFLLL